MKIWVLFLSLICILVATNGPPNDNEVVTLTSTATVTTCSLCTKTTSSSQIFAGSSKQESSSPTSAPTSSDAAPCSCTVTVTSVKVPRVVLATKTECARCNNGQVTWVTPPAELVSIGREYQTSVKPCVQCDKSPNCTEPIRAMDKGDVPPCRICCNSASAKLAV